MLSTAGQSAVLNPQFDLSVLNPAAINNHVDQLINHREFPPDDLYSRMIRMSVTYPEIEFLFKIDGIGCISLSDIIVLKGKAKAGKSTFLIALIAALLKGEYMGLTSLKKDAKVLYIDTEMNFLNTAILTRKVHALCGFTGNTDHPQFRAYNFRGDSPSERCRLTLEAVKLFKPDLLIIDGARDLIKGGDINDQKGSGKVIQFLMSLTKEFNLALITTLHENKADSNLRGAIGTELLNKCSECWQVKKSGDKFDVEQTDCRNEPVSGFSFSFNEEKLPVPVNCIPKNSASEEKNQKMQDGFKQCLPQGESIRYSELKNKYIELLSCSPKTAESHIAKAVKDDLLVKDEAGNYSFNYQIKIDALPSTLNPTLSI